MRQKNILSSYESLMAGDNRNAYKYWLEEYKLEPFNLELNSTAMVLALQYVNKPRDIDTIYTAFGLKDQDLDVENEYLETRFYVKGMTNLELGRVQETIELLLPFSGIKMKDYDWLKEVLIRAYAIKGNKDSVDVLIDHIKLFADLKNYHKSCLITGNEFLRVGNVPAAHDYYDRLITSMAENKGLNSQQEREFLARAYFYKKDYQKAQDILENILKESKDQITFTAYLAMACYKNGHPKKAETLLDRLDDLRSDYQFGEIDYALARYYAIAENEEKVMDYLLKAVAAGKRYNPAEYQHDILFKPYVGTEGFNRIMNYWH
jgi:tetratricopeptide (TPR) repeat protein